MPRRDLRELQDEALESMSYLGSDERASNLKDASSLVLKPNKENHPKTPPWVHFVAGGIGGMAGAVLTCPFDVVKTRLQSDVFKTAYKSHAVVSPGYTNLFSTTSRHLKETFDIIFNVYRVEGFRSLFKGLGPNLVGVIPARSINFFTYGVTKDICCRFVDHGEETPLIHFIAGAIAGWATSTATNPIWLVKTRLQLAKQDSNSTAKYKNSWDCVKSVVRNEGILGLYKGLSASYLGSIESILQWILYEQMKRIIKQRSIDEFGDISEGNKTTFMKVKEWCQRSGSAGVAKFIASVITYPHEVVRTRLRQTPLENGKPKYRGLLQTFRVIIKEEGMASMYGGLTPHLLRTVPNSMIMFGTWELVIKLLS
ncbi:HDR071Cp [Eremothecium sinecaudum]|uniref:HDR071Cp n=1 Tax=Eremothecium sinecaudum TaxID=45286 RepID=A0A0X8HSX4_9SACH|nr:HDR071Cp [Eremothecium sinecaudum]AMD20813.1 HDR071Cp [Eremothecium sinecaudum]